MVFGFLAFFIAAAIRARRGTLSPSATALLVAALAGFGGMSEILQHYTGRDASISDFIGDVLGTWIGAAIFHFAAARVLERRMLRVSLATAVVLAVFPFGLILSAYAYRHSQQPVIWRAASVLLDKFAHRRRGEYPGLELTELPPDWRGFRELLITVRNPSMETAVFFVRANDIHHDQHYADRYNGSFTISPGRTQIYRVSLQEIINAPFTRKMDLSQMSGLVVFEKRDIGVHNIDVREISLAY